MTEEVREIYMELWMLCRDTKHPLRHRYRSLREAFERVSREQMQNVSLQSTDLAARINYLSVQFSLKERCKNALHTFRLTSNDVMNHRKEPVVDEFLRDARSVADAYQGIFDTPIPKELDELFPRRMWKIPMKRAKMETFRRIRVCFDHADEEFLYVHPVDEVSEENWRVRYNQLGVNDEFTEGIVDFWRHAQLNLLDVRLNEDGTYTPSFIVLEPDYLIDISTLAECYRDYGSHPANYLMSRLVPIDNARPLLLGNIANLFLDEWIYAGEEAPDYLSCMKKAFRQYPIELAVCEELQDVEKEKAFFKDCRMHFEHIRQTVTETFLASGYNLDKSDAVLEPSYICEALGIQGRLDYMQRDMSSFIEMKSGKADEYAIKGKIEPKENNRVQMLLYMAVLEYSMGIDRCKQHPYLLYTRYPLLYPARASWAQVRRIIALRNRIVANEYGTQMHNHPSYTANLLAQINPLTLNEKKKNDRFWEQYLKPGIENFQKRLQSLDALEKIYVYTLYNFITKELYTSKSGDVESESRTGASMLWLSTLDEKREAGEILYDLRIVDNQASLPHKANVTLRIPAYDEPFLPNFRQGDVVVFYERNAAIDNVTNKLVFKGNIERLTATEVCIRLRAAQRNLAVFPSDSLYAMEHDYMDTTFRSMYLGLSAFMEANQERKDLLLRKRKPLFDEAALSKNAHFIDDFERVATKAVAAKDYFLLVGPPGTGKTSRALRRMVEKFYAQPDTQILLLAYTNRAVDEICSSLSSIIPSIDYIRIGSELSCDVRFREHLVENVLASYDKRKDVLQRLSACRVYVGTVASLSSKTELFKLKRFDVAIVDEATQILEPHLLWLLSAKSSDGRDAVGKFILIGDHKQLPAVVLQSKEESEVFDESLRRIGLFNLKDSLFERLYRSHLSEGDSPTLDMLCRQGRMHPDVASFPNQAFYGGRLEPIGLPHQMEEISAPVLFLPSQRDTENLSGKTNRYEARMVADWAERIWLESPDSFDSHHTLGIITPYRSQIALIRKELQVKDIPALNEISVDTVERYQGSERDVILYSFCVNHRYQLKFLPNLTEENGVLIDRKLNVALTRARKRLIIVGVLDILKENPIYAQLISAYDRKE
ncbi:MAG: AAA family ATPase [Bacteroidaceae bacterium]|nr:AAA family ATPase [Bacteroidaceae bacterium]